MDEKAVRSLMASQAGVISRRQVLELGGTDGDIRRLLRQRRWASVHDGVYVEHTGPPTQGQRWWAAVLRCAPAALAGYSALDAHGVRGHHRPDAPVVVGIAQHRYLAPVAGITVERIAGFEGRCQPHLSPPRLRVEEALVREASRKDRPEAALAVLADAVQSRRTTVERLVATLRRTPRLRHRRLLLVILEDVAAGAFSVLEHRYLTRVERPHGLPVAVRQRRVRPGRILAYRDVEYLEQATTIELDGRIGHEETSDSWADLDRDPDAAATGGLTLRAGWKQVLQQCRLAGVVAAVLVSRGWTSRPRACGPGCVAPAGGDL